MDLAPIEKSLAFSPVLCLANIGIFIVLLLVMNAVYWKPMLAHLKKRDKEITDAYSQRDRLQHEMETLRSDYLARLAVIEAEARSHIQAAVKEAQTERERILAEARASSDAALKTGIANLEREMAEALQSLHGNMVGLASNAAGKALGGSVDPSVLRSAVEQRMKFDSAQA
jgi:F-type H+-transporting ATPase subunit b